MERPRPEPRATSRVNQARPALAGLRLWSRWPRRTIRIRLALLFFAMFLVSGAALLAVTVAVWQGRTRATTAEAVPTPAGRLSERAAGITQHTSDRHELLLAAGIALAIMGGLSLVLGWLVAGGFLRPLRTITMSARNISAANLHQRLNLDGPDDELKELGDTFDELLARLERSFAVERRFVANASHELRTPLATMRASLDVAMAKPGPLPAQMVTLAERLRREFDQVDRLLESFLTLAHSQHGHAAADESTSSLTGLASVAVERRFDAIALKNITVEFDRADSPKAWVNGSATLLARMVANVIDNAVIHNQPGGWIRIQTSVAGRLARLIVENGGSVLAQEEVEQLARPFQRIGAERTGSDRGSGLGLSIVASIAEAHAGVLELQARTDGGLRVVIALPAASTPSAEERA